MFARLKTPVQPVWQYLEAPVINIPLWVNKYVEMHGDGLYLVRASGKQLIDPTDWLVQESSTSVLWLTDAEFQREYELLMQAPSGPDRIAG